MDKTSLKKRNNIISLNMDADFYVDRAFRSLDRYRYDKARRYVMRAIELDPENPVNHCNLAGILSEMGQYEASNEILHNIVEKLDPTLTECYFYLANNYANMDDFEEAEDWTIRYLEKESDGEFAYEAQDMLEFISYELQGSVEPRRTREKNDVEYLHDHACRQLEAGKFHEAIEMLEKLTVDSPEFLASLNNLALAYFYIGQFDKAMSTVESLLQIEPNNIHGLCNAAIFYQHKEEFQSLEPLINVMRKLVPFHIEHVHKLATTMGILGEHDTAYRLFMRMVKESELVDHNLYHSLAVAALYTGRYEQAEKMWRNASRLDQETDIPLVYLRLLKEWMENDRRNLRQLPYIPYHYHAPNN